MPPRARWSRTLCSAVAGVEPQSETVWRQADKYRVPRIAFMNKMDQVEQLGARGSQTMVDRLGPDPLAHPVAHRAGGEPPQVIDLVRIVASCTTTRWE